MEPESLSETLPVVYRALLDAREREQLRRAFFWQGFGMLGGDCFVHPGADLKAVFDTLAADGFSPLLPSLISMVAEESGNGLAVSTADLVRQAWDLEQLARAYSGFVAAYGPILDRVTRTGTETEEDAFLLRILLIHDYRRLLLRDPDLPEELLPGRWPGRQARSLCRDLYRRLLAPSERHLESCLRLADGSLPAADSILAARFPGEG